MIRFASRGASLASAFSVAIAFTACAPPERPAAPQRPSAHGPAAEIAPAREAMVVATIHKGHLFQHDYPVALLCRIIRVYDPDLVMVEIRPEPFAAGHYEDGPFEMTAATMCARGRGIDVAPIDWWLESEMAVEPPALSPAEQAAMDSELTALEEPAWPAFDVVNSAAELERGLRLLNVQARYLGGNAVWERRQAFFHHRALEALEHTRAKRALLFVGFNHAPELAAFLGGVGVKMVSPLSLALGEPKLANDAMPDSVVEAWRSGADRLRASADAAPGDSKARYAAKVRYFDVAVSRKGTCCVREADLAPR